MRQRPANSGSTAAAGPVKGGLKSQGNIGKNVTGKSTGAAMGAAKSTGAAMGAAAKRAALGDVSNAAPPAKEKVFII